MSKSFETPKPRIIEDIDVVVKVTGSTVCGSDLHLADGARHEFYGNVTNFYIYHIHIIEDISYIIWSHFNKDARNRTLHVDFQRRLRGFVLG
jgi:hypothetical protein